MHILICYDGSYWARRSTRFALRLFANTDHRLTVLVVDRPDHDISEPVADEPESDRCGADRSMTELESDVRELVDKLDVSPQLNWRHETGEMFDAITTVCGDCELICVGGTGRGVYSASMLGTVGRRLVRQGRKNILVTKHTDEVCRNAVVAVTESGFDARLAHHLGTLFESTSTRLNIEILWGELPTRFQGYLDASIGRRLQQMIDADMFDRPDEIARPADILESYDLDVTISFQSRPSLDHLIDDFEDVGYDLVVLRARPHDARLLRQFEPDNRLIELMRRSIPNVMVLRTLDAER